MPIMSFSDNQPGKSQQNYEISVEHRKIADLLAMPGVEDIEFDIPQQRDLATFGEFDADFGPVPNSSTVSK
jgi:hypothetical protein